MRVQFPNQHLSPPPLGSFSTSVGTVTPDSPFSV